MKQGKIFVHKDILLSSPLTLAALADFVLFLGRMYPDVALEPGRRFLESVQQLGERRGISILRILAKEFCRIPFDKCSMTIEAESTSRVVFVEKGEAVLTLSFGYSIDGPDSGDSWHVVESLDLQIFGSESERQFIANGESPSDRRRTATENLRVMNSELDSNSL